MLKLVCGNEPLVNIGARIGRGRAGEVFGGENNRTGTPIAIKRVPLEHVASLESAWRALKDLRHPSVIRVLDFEITARGAALTMARADASLDDMVMDGPSLLRAARQVAEALEYLHDRGWVHRDIKPSNLLMQGKDVVISDFGMVVGLPHPGAIDPAGTPAYMAPETFFWETGPAVDWYALGVTLYELAMGVVPFAGSMSQNVVLKQNADYDPVPTGLHGLALMIDGLLLPDPKARWGAAEVLAHLDGVEPLSRRASA